MCSRSCLMHAEQSPPLRPLDVASWDVTIENRPGGVVFVRPNLALGRYPCRLTDRLDEWAERAPHRTFLAERDSTGEWRRLSYAEFRMQAGSIAHALLDRGLTPERPVAILSGNDMEHALLAVAAMYAGIAC